jgi:septal ring factor EnvC (AmiA/AmiB activator)
MDNLIERLRVANPDTDWVGRSERYEAARELEKAADRITALLEERDALRDELTAVRRSRKDLMNNIAKSIEEGHTLRARLDAAEKLLERARNASINYFIRLAITEYFHPSQEKE